MLATDQHEMTCSCLSGGGLCLAAPPSCHLQKSRGGCPVGVVAKDVGFCVPFRYACTHGPLDGAQFWNLENGPSEGGARGPRVPAKGLFLPTSTLPLARPPLHDPAVL